MADLGKIVFLFFILLLTLFLCYITFTKNSFNENENIVNEIPNTTSNESKTKPIKIAHGNFTGKNNDESIFITKLSDDRVCAILYEHNGNELEFICEIDTFSSISDFQILENKDGDILVVREIIDQITGAFESGKYLRFYRYNKTEEKFALVLSLTESFDAYWNRMWSKENYNHWLRISEKCGINWDINQRYGENDKNEIVVDVVRRQNVAKSLSNLDNPYDNEFDVIASRDVWERYTWSDKWQHFILFEGIDEKTGEAVAVIEDLSSSPFMLDSEFSNEHFYRIKRANNIANNTIETVMANTIRQ